MLLRLSFLLCFICVCTTYSVLFTTKPVVTFDVRFTKMTQSGELLHPHDGPWQCVLDSQ